MNRDLRRNLGIPPKTSFFLFGPRQVGKSTLLKKYFNSKTSLYVDLLDINTSKDLIINPGKLKEWIEFRNPSISHIIIDEIQKIPELLDTVHWCIENLKDPPIFVLTGSSARKLKRSNANMLGGRALSLSMFPLNHQEILSAYPETQDFPLHKILRYGSLPAIFLEDDDELRKQKLYSYGSTYLAEEVKAESLVRNLNAFVRFLDLAAEENACLINYSKLSMAIGIDASTIKEYYQILEDTLLGSFLYPYHNSTRKQLSKQPKFYFFDLGVCKALSGKIELNLDSGNKEFGLAFEHFIINEIMHLSKYKNKNYKFYFYRTGSGTEVDLIVKTVNKYFAIEIKSGTNLKAKDLNGLKSFRELEPDAECICVSTTQHQFKVGDFMVYPWQKVFELLDLA